MAPIPAAGTADRFVTGAVGAPTLVPVPTNARGTKPPFPSDSARDHS
jgi:hypothetical protein